jgi:hypothetical protein
LLRWHVRVQGLYDNYLLNGTPFYDQPASFYQPPVPTQAFFDANAYLAVEDTTDDTWRFTVNRTLAEWLPRWPLIEPHTGKM